VPKQNAVKPYATFIGGLITEASPLTYPENASIDEENFLLNRDGSRQRRLGMNYEAGYSEVDTGFVESVIDDYAIETYRWDNVGSDSNVSIGIVQVGPYLWFVDLYADAQSASLLNGGSSLKVGVNGVNPYQFSSVNGILIVTTGETNPLGLEYNSATDSITSTEITIKIRDMIGLDDFLDIDENPTTLSAYHKYNLFNQGWSGLRVTSYFSAEGEYPNNTEIATLGKDASDNFSSALLRKQDFGNTPAPKGHFILDAFNRGLSRYNTATYAHYFNNDRETGFLQTTCSNAGRIFYSGVNSKIEYPDDLSPNYTGFVFFSRVVENTEDLGKCYQEADPTSEHIFDLVDTDGGYIPIPEANNIIKLIAAGESVIVIAENGIWEIYGGDTGFLATEYQVSKITNVGCVSAQSVVEAEDKIFYWAKSGIYVLSKDQISGKHNSNNITETTIQTLYTDIPGVSKANVKGNYDPISRKVSWLYCDGDDYDGILFKNNYKKELVLDLVISSFYKNTLSCTETDSPFIASYLSTPNFNITEITRNVVVDGDQVTASGSDVVMTSDERGRGESTTKYLTIIPSSGNYEFTFSYYSDTRFLDWYDFDGVGQDYTSFLITGHEVAGDIVRRKQVPYVFFYFNRTESGYTETDGILNQSSCKVRARWDWSDSANSGKWGTEFQAYRLNRRYIPEEISDDFDYGHEVIVTKNMLRGRGRALSLYIASETGKDMHLLGWGSVLSVEGRG